MQGSLSKLLYLCFTTIPVIAAYYLKLRYKRLKKVENEKKDFYYHSIFIHSRSGCKEHICKAEACGEQCSLNHLLTLVHFIASAKESISICVLTLQLQSIILELIKAHNRGLNVRLILDREMVSETSKRHEILKSAGIVRTQGRNGGIFHHKFCLIDEKNVNSARMWFGSFNFTMQGIVRNFEHITLTNDSRIIKAFSDEFEKLWRDFAFNNLC